MPQNIDTHLHKVINFVASLKHPPSIATSGCVIVNRCTCVDVPFRVREAIAGYSQISNCFQLQEIQYIYMKLNLEQILYISL